MVLYILTLCLVPQSCLTLRSPMDCSPPGFSVPGDSPGNNAAMGCHAFPQGIFTTQRSNPGLPHYRWILYHLSRQGSPNYGLISSVLNNFSRVHLFVTPWTEAHQAPLFMRSSRQEYLSGLPFPLPEDLPSPGIEPASLVFPESAGRFFTTEPLGKP